MNLKIEENAVQWFKEVAELKKGETVRLMISYEEEAINRSYYPGFSLKFLVEVPNLLVTHFKKDGILFYIEISDDAIFQEKSLDIKYDPIHDDIFFEMQDMK